MQRYRTSRGKTFIRVEKERGKGRWKADTQEQRRNAARLSQEISKICRTYTIIKTFVRAIFSTFGRFWLKKFLPISPNVLEKNFNIFGKVIKTSSKNYWRLCESYNTQLSQEFCIFNYIFNLNEKYWWMKDFWNLKSQKIFPVRRLNKIIRIRIFG